ncbi:MAG: type II toxin-antitoxin system YoeB family toxin [Hymenobacter sp.]|nr:type II toxin-antitoxin system YoeB family toxin [Hymenobacter sp.]
MKAWERYLYWQKTDEAILRKLNDLLQEYLRTPRAGKGNLTGYWSRRIRPFRGSGRKKLL